MRYRLYFRAGADGPFVRVEEIDAEADHEAVTKAERFVGIHPMELWFGSRYVRGFAPRGDKPPIESTRTSVGRLSLWRGRPT